MSAKHRISNYNTDCHMVNNEQILTGSNMSDWLSSVLKSAEPARIRPVTFGWKIIR